MTTNVYKVIKINKTTNEIEVLTDNEFLPIARMIARTDKHDNNFEIKIINNATNKEIEITPKTNNKDYTYTDYNKGIRFNRNNHFTFI